MKVLKTNLSHIILNDFCTAPPYIKLKTSVNYVIKTNDICIKNDAYCFEHALALVRIHPWANIKRVFDQSERASYFCYVIK